MIRVGRARELAQASTAWQHCPLQRAVDRDTLAAFLAISRDCAPLHDPDSDAPVVPGNLLLALLPSLLQSGLVVERAERCLTVALNRIKFSQPVSLEQPLGLRYQLREVRARGDATFVVVALQLYRLADGATVLRAEQTDCYLGDH